MKKHLLILVLTTALFSCQVIKSSDVKTAEIYGPKITQTPTLADLEVIEKKDDKEPGDKLWGLAWEVESIEATHKRLLDEGVDVTPIKEGIKEKTLVATINSHTHNVPTLLIEHVR